MKTLLSRTSLALPFFFALLLFPVTLRAQAPVVKNAAETALALKKLNVVGSVLYIAAHPDDENTALLAYLANERGVRTGYLSMTRGDGGQNLLGTEKGELLGVVRTQELLAARRIDGAEQFFTRAIDFGFTKSPEETLRIWGHDAALADVVWVIRLFRPDVIITRFPTTGEGGHGQHTASAILAVEAFDAAADPARFPEQLRDGGVQTWKPKRLLWNAFNFRPGEKPKDADKLVSVDVGAYNALLGKSYTEIAAESRTMHKSQGQGTPTRRGASLNYFVHLKGEPATKDIFDGVDLSWRHIAGGEQIGQLLEEASRKYDAANPPASLPLLMRAYRGLEKLPRPEPLIEEPLVEAKRAALLEVIRACAELWIEAIAPEPSALPGVEVRVAMTLVNRSDFPFRFTGVSVFGLAVAHPVGAAETNVELKNNQPLTREFNLPTSWEYSQPYWLRDEPGKGLFTVKNQLLIGEPDANPALFIDVALSTGDGGLSFRVPVLFRWTDRVRGEMYRPVVVVPEVAVNLEDKTLVFPDRQPKQVRVNLKSNVAAATSGTLRLKLPAGWSATPSEISVTLKSRDEEFKASFNITPPANATTAALNAEFESGGKTFTRGLLEIDYPHIPRQTLFPPARAKLVRLDLQKRGERIGYVMGSGDEIPDALRQVGYQVTLLSDEDLDSADLKDFDAIITGVRAYNTRARLRARQQRLLDYVSAGGTLIVQYNTSDASLANVALGPYPFKLSSQDRVTVEEAPVRVLAPQDALLNAPNKISDADFEGWVQERGLYFTNDWDAKYTTLFETHDPGEKELSGSTLVARVGRGTYIYTSLSWFRQLPAGVPGAYRLFVNLISAGRK